MKENINEFNPLLVEQLREQVGNLMAAAQLLTPAIREQEDRKYDQYLAILNQSMYRLLRLTEHVDFFGRSEKQACHPVAVDLSQLCRELCDQVIPLARQMKVAFFYAKEGRDLVLDGDSVLLRRMLLNLVANALQAALPDGRAGLRLAVGGDHVRITVWDDGAGEDVVASLEETDQALEERLKQRSSLGLGVEIAREIATLHGGTLVMERGENCRGTRAVISLPVGQVSSGRLRSPKMGYDPTGGFSLALVELSEVLPYTAFLPDDVE